MRRRKTAQQIDRRTLTADSRLKRAQVVGLIAEETRKPGDSARQARDRVSHRIAYAVEKGWLRPNAEGFLVGELAHWIRTEWPHLARDLPAAPLEATMASTCGIRCTFEAVVVPGTLDRCQAALREAQDTIDKLILELRSTRTELEELRPSAERWEALREKNRESGRKRHSESEL